MGEQNLRVIKARFSLGYYKADLRDWLLRTRGYGWVNSIDLNRLGKTVSPVQVKALVLLRR